MFLKEFSIVTRKKEPFSAIPDEIEPSQMAYHEFSFTRRIQEHMRLAAGV